MTTYFTFLFYPASGLMFASRFPIISAHFEPFTNKKPMSWQMLISYGVLVAKVRASKIKVKQETGFFYLHIFTSGRS
jgi:hypothetical protein